MGWNYPGISLEEMVKLIKGFVDILILASGCQSSGLPAHWNARNIKKALQWGIFFENVFTHLSSSEVYLDSLKELDTSVTEITSNPSFPQGLSNLSTAALRKGRAFVSEHFIRALPLSDAHLEAFLRAAIEMDLNELMEKEHDCLNIYLSKLTLLDSTVNLVQEPMRESTVPSSDIASTTEIDISTAEDFTHLAVQGCLKRQSAVSCISTVKSGIDILSSAIKRDSWISSDNSLVEEHLRQDRSLALTGNVDTLVDFVTWSCWKSKNLLYFLDMRTIRLVSGASMIFSAPKFQWVQVLERLHISAEGSDDKLSEIIELLLLGCIASRWSGLIEHFTSIAYNPLSISQQYQKLWERGLQNFYSKEEMISSKESCILEYLAGILSGRLHQLWKLSPALVAVGIPSWSMLYRLYFNEIETQFKGDPLRTRYCSCFRDGKEHKSCLYGERTLRLMRTLKFWGTVSLFVLSTELNMKTFKIINTKRLQFLEWWKTMASTRSAVTLGNVQRRVPTVCCCKCKSHVLRPLLWKFKSMRKQALGWKGINTQFSYDIHSYSLNFDDGFSRQ